VLQYDLMYTSFSSCILLLKWSTSVFSV